MSILKKAKEIKVELNFFDMCTGIATDMIFIVIIGILIVKATGFLSLAIIVTLIDITRKIILLKKIANRNTPPK